MKQELKHEAWRSQSSTSGLGTLNFKLNSLQLFGKSEDFLLEHRISSIFYQRHSQEFLHTLFQTGDFSVRSHRAQTATEYMWAPAWHSTEKPISLEVGWRRCSVSYGWPQQLQVTENTFPTGLGWVRYLRISHRAWHLVGTPWMLILIILLEDFL